MKVIVELYGMLRNITDGEKTLLIELEKEITLKELISYLVKKNPKFGVLLDRSGILSNEFLFFINDTDITLLNGENTLLKDGSKVSIIPISHGG